MIPLDTLLVFPANVVQGLNIGNIQLCKLGPEGKGLRLPINML